MEDRILKQIQNILDEKSITVNCDSTLADVLDSITFIEIVVAVEREFDFEFDDEMLLITKFPTTKTMVEYVKGKVNTF